ncbi:DedA family protein [Aquicoccus sp. G2-2]|uniref:DedA family protein n=1 Tax=Aquicoccus sp. G2-2 TaxID=3092120 RepID=UPI002AE049E3|nr:DedA family protein [Aquicoccus sp. G2-2]MEA1112646.1 DedA family protein [Aquicoccus sp. G2-2]
MQLETLIQQFGLPGLTLGGAFEGDGIAFLGGVLAHRGLFGFEAAVWAVWLGAVIVDNAFFLIGRYARERAFVQRQVTKRAVRVLHGWIERHPALSVLGFRYLYGLKTAGALLFGMSRLSWVRFAILDLIAVLLWAHVLVGLGFVAGHTIEALFGQLRLHEHLGVALVVLLVGAVLLWWITRRRVERRGKK